MSSIRGVSVGGNLYDVTDTTNIAPKEPTGYASREYQVGRTFIMADGLLYKATAHINVGDAIVVNSNAERTNVDELFEATENVEAIPTMLNVLGAKNLLPNNATTQTLNGITWTVNSDGTITANGTATGTSYITINTALSYPYDVILTGCPSGGAFETYMINASGGYLDYGDGVLIPANSNLDAVCIIKSGTTADNLVFKPMIRPASIADDTYVPYAMTNRKLTENSQWKYLGQSTGTSYVYLPSDFSEIQVDVSITASRQVTYHIIKEQLSSSEKRFISGTYFSANDNNGCSIGCTVNAVGVLYAYVNGIDKISTATMTVYYK